MNPVDIQGDRYGYVRTNKKGQPVFRPLGRAPYFGAVYESIEDDSVVLKLATEYFGREKIAYLKHGDMLDVKGAKRLGDLGFDVSRATMDAFYEAIRVLEEYWEEIEEKPIASYSSLGWIRVPYVDLDTGEIDSTLCYRCHKLIGSKAPAKYLGDLAVGPHGDYEVWREMVVNDVIPYDTLQLVLVAALSAVVVGALSYAIPFESDILHLHLPSSRGKSASGFLACSTTGKPATAKIPHMDEDGRNVELRSCLQSWGATDNALIHSLANNRGAVIVLDELGKCLTKNMNRVIFDLVDGSDKRRLSSDLTNRDSSAFLSSFISTGECSLLERCDSRLEGLAIRIMEVNTPLTKDAAHANRIKRVCSQHHGFAAPAMAEYIIDRGGENYVLERYDYWRDILPQHFSNTPNVHRFIEKFAALYMCTAEIATKALNLPFDMNRLQAYLVDYDNNRGESRNTSLESYELLLAHCNKNEQSFVHRHDKTYIYGKGRTETIGAPNREMWGRITEMTKPLPDGRVLVREYEIMPLVAEDFLKSKGFNSMNTCIDAWKNADLLDYEDDTHAKRKRTFNTDDAPGRTEKVYVLREYEEGDSAQKLLDELEKRKAKLAKTKGRKQVKSLLVEAAKGGNASA